MKIFLWKEKIQLNILLTTISLRILLVLLQFGVEILFLPSQHRWLKSSACCWCWIEKRRRTRKGRRTRKTEIKALATRSFAHEKNIDFHGILWCWEQQNMENIFLLAHYDFFLPFFYWRAILERLLVNRLECCSVFRRDFMKYDVSIV